MRPPCDASQEKGARATHSPLLTSYQSCSDTELSSGRYRSSQGRCQWHKAYTDDGSAQYGRQESRPLIDVSRLKRLEMKR